MLFKKKITWVYIISLLFILINTYLIYKELYYLTLFPIGILVLLFAFFSLDKLLLLLVFITPFSIPLSEIIPGLDFNMYIPTEPLLFCILIIFIFKMLIEQKFDKKILLHPISIAIYINLIWILITSITSTMPIISFKFLLSRLWFIVAFYFLISQVFRNQKYIYTFFWLYIISLIIVIIHTIIKHMGYGLLDQEAANFVVTPFFNDHTSYGAVLAMFLPIIIGVLISKRIKPKIKLFVFIVFLIFVFAIILSYTRATWISIIVALFVLIFIILKIKFKYILIVSGILIFFFFTFQNQILMSLEQNQQESSKNIAEHVQSISNITSDASNLERINRWNCAIKMFEEKPVFGWGPGTYMFNYAPFQLSYEKTIISTNAGDKGNAHSEYLGPLAESGFLGMITFLIIIITTLYVSIRLYSKLKNRELKIILISVTLGLITYYFHGFLNNFLDTDKASIPFWGFTAIILAIDVYHSKFDLGIKEKGKIKKIQDQ